MFKVGVLLMLAGVALSAPPPPPPSSPVDAHVQVQFDQFKTKFGKTYGSPAEEEARRATFAANLQFIAEHNAKHAAGEVHFTVGVNQFADMNKEEWVSWLGEAQVRPPMNEASTFMAPKNVGSVPDSINWVDLGYVTGVKDQGQCGSCWSFSATGALEGAHFGATGDLISLSEQNLVDCAGAKYGNYGCNGGWPYQAFDYIKANNGIDTEKSYPYQAEQEKCRYNSANNAATLKSYTTIKKGSESDLKTAVGTVGPVSVCIDASHTSFQLYQSGVYSEPRCSSTRLDHAVLTVGYGNDPSGGDYWLVKNSWSTTWGMEGYIEMARNHDNECGIAEAGVYPTV